MKEIRFAIVGCGVISTMQAEAINHTPNAKIVAACDILEDKLNAFCEKYSVKKAYTNYLDLLQDDEVDVVCVCVPSGLHHEIAINAAKAGKNILCEKPLDIAKDKMDAMIKAAEENGVILAGVLQRRTMETAKRAKEYIESDKLGRVVMANAYLKYLRTQEYYNSAGWRGTWEMDGGGCLMNQGIHGVDLLGWMMGGISSLFAYADHLVRDIKVEDTAVIAVKFKNGAFGTIQSATSMYKEEDTYFEIYGEKGVIKFGDQGIYTWNTEDDGDVNFDAGESIGGSAGPQIGWSGHQKIVENLVNSINSGEKLVADGQSAREGVDIILAIYESVKENKEIVL